MGAGTAGIETLAPMTVTQSTGQAIPLRFTDMAVQIVDILPRERRGTWNSIYLFVILSSLWTHTHTLTLRKAICSSVGAISVPSYRGSSQTVLSAGDGSSG